MQVVRQGVDRLPLSLLPQTDGDTHDIWLRLEEFSYIHITSKPCLAAPLLCINTLLSTHVHIVYDSLFT